jgi:RNase P subunit RPR2
MLALVLVGGVLCVWSFVRYQFMLSRAVRAAGRSICSNCTSYGVLDVVRRSEPEPSLRVRCRKCGHEWTIE